MKMKIVSAVLLSVVLVSSPGCDATKLMSPEDRATYQELQEDIAERDAVISDSLAVAEGLRDQIEFLLGEMAENGASADSIAAVNEANALLADTLDVVTEYESLSRADVSTLEELEAKALAPGGEVMDFLGRYFPPLNGLSDAWGLLALLLFKRPQESAYKAIRKTSSGLMALGKAQPIVAGKLLLSAVRSAGAVIGLDHTTRDPNKLLAVALKKAGNDDLEIAVDGNGDSVLVPKS